MALPSLPADWTEAFTIVRAAAGSYANAAGAWAPGSTTTIPALGVIEPLTPEQIAELALGEQVQEAFYLYTSTPILPTSQVNQTQADRLTWKGDTYEVISVTHRTQIPDLDHYKVTAKRVEGT